MEGNMSCLRMNPMQVTSQRMNPMHGEKKAKIGKTYNI
jgi:hypothetical protein